MSRGGSPEKDKSRGSTVVVRAGKDTVLSTGSYPLDLCDDFDFDWIFCVSLRSFHVRTVQYCSLWLQVLLVIRGLKKDCDYGYPIHNKQVGVILYFENIDW